MELVDAAFNADVWQTLHVNEVASMISHLEWMVVVYVAEGVKLTQERETLWGDWVSRFITGRPGSFGQMNLGANTEQA